MSGKLFWVTFRDASMSDNLLGCYVVSSSSLKIVLFWPHGEVVDYQEILPRSPIETYNPVRMETS